MYFYLINTITLKTGYCIYKLTEKFGSLNRNKGIKLSKDE